MIDDDEVSRVLRMNGWWMAIWEVWLMLFHLPFMMICPWWYVVDDDDKTCLDYADDNDDADYNDKDDDDDDDDYIQN